MITVRDGNNELQVIPTLPANDGKSLSVMVDRTANLYIPDSNLVGRSLKFEDDFNFGPAGFVQLIDGTRPRGPLTLDSRITAPGSRYSLRLNTASVPDASYNHGQCMAIKRMARGPVGGRVYLAFMFSFGARSSETVDGALTTQAPRALQWGLDQADLNGLRRYFKIRWEQFTHFTGGVGDGRFCKFQLQQADGTFYDIPGGVFPFGYNENKRNLHLVEMIFDLDNLRYDGLRVDGKGFGSLAADPDTSLQAFSPAPLPTLQTFAGGFNVTMELLNRTDSWLWSEAWSNLAYTRGLIL